MYKRFILFYKSLINNSNLLTRTCAQLALHGSRSAVSNSLTTVCHFYKCPRFDISNFNVSHNSDSLSDTKSNIASVVRDLMNVKHRMVLFPNEHSFFNYYECNSMLHELCTN